ncbi:DsbA family oxidoreductase [Pseudomonas sp. OIL-1]|uniref:DsbA family oxidoreductase n=1 Tax=Pseudomonas sp. OIL-1 TaxID=2706126 RepID=UPI0013A78BA1|nr:DsbA family oxidoreductase [Pseudomonas sp. OIL-1]QIB49831.1 DsbA family oxidoreductase [Pseudomonas sp. OIL-1]
MNNTLHIDIVSDIACPWCAIGYARLERAMAGLEGELAFSIEWHAFELNPDASGEGEPILQALSRKYGRSESEMEAAQANMVSIATGLGLNFEKMQQRRTANTFDAHRLVKWAGEQGRQTQMKQAFFDAYFGRAENVGDQQVLLRCVETIGLDAADAQAVLASERYAEAVRADEERYRQAGVTGVPAFIINGQYMIAGAQEPETLMTALRDIASGNPDV